MNFMDKLPTVISCCFCCFLRAGTVMIAVFSFLVGVMFAPNVAHAKGFGYMESVLSNYSAAMETTIHMTLGLISIMLCVVSALLMVGALCNFPFLILIYQWGAMIYSSTVCVLFFILACLCFFVHTNCYLAGSTLCALIVVDLVLTAYFILVANSLRVSLKLLFSDDFCKSVI